MSNSNSNFSFKDIKNFVFERIKWAKDTPIFLGYFFFIFGLIGTLGIWYPVAKNGYWAIYVIDEMHPQNLLGFSMPVLTALLIDGTLELFSKKEKNKTLVIYAIITGFIACSFIWYGIIQSEKQFYPIAFIGWILVLILWFLVNAGNAKFEDKTNTGAPAAEDTPADTQHLSGKGVDGDSK